MTQFNKSMYFDPNNWNPPVAEFTQEDIENILTEAGYSFISKDELIMHDIFVIETNPYDVEVYRTTISDDTLANKDKLMEWLNNTLISKELLFTDTTDYATISSISFYKDIYDLSDDFKKDIEGLFRNDEYNYALLFGEEGASYKFSNAIPNRHSENF